MRHSLGRFGILIENSCRLFLFLQVVLISLRWVSSSGEFHDLALKQLRPCCRAMHGAVWLRLRKLQFSGDHKPFSPEMNSISGNDFPGASLLVL